MLFGGSKSREQRIHRHKFGERNHVRGVAVLAFFDAPQAEISHCAKQGLARIMIAAKSSTGRPLHN